MKPLNQTWIRELGICTVRAATTSSMTMNWTVFDHQLPMFHSKVGLQQIHTYVLSAVTSDTQPVSKRKPTENSADELFIRSNASKRPCARQGVRGLWNLGQSCFMNVILQALLHDPILNTHFLGNSHQTQECTIPDCVGCAVAEAFTEFNATDKPESFAILSLLAATWKGSEVSCLASLCRSVPFPQTG